MKKPLLVLVFAAVACAVVPPVSAAAEGDARSRMEQRLPSLVSLKQRKVVGENNRGFLEVRGTATAEETQLVEAENRDRDTAYGEIAAKVKTTKEVVGRDRAKIIAERSARGDLIQDVAGGWAEKR